MSRPFMPFYDGDWLRDTAHLDDHQERAYFRLVMFYWANKGLPNDETQLRRICGKHHNWWGKNRKLLSDFFDVNGSGYWTHKRIDYELSKSEKFSQKQRENSAKGNAKRWPKERQTIARARVPQPQPESYKEKEVTNVTSKKKVRHQLPTDWAPDPSSLDYGRKLGLTANQIASQCEAMQIWAASNGEAKADWNATLKGFLRRDAESLRRVRNLMGPNSRAGPVGRSNGSTEAISAFISESNPDDPRNRRAGPSSPVRTFHGPQLVWNGRATEDKT